MLGTGTPIPDPDRRARVSSSSWTACRISSTRGRASFGARLPRTRRRAGTRECRNLQHVFLTHLHSDHTLGLADLLFTPWVQGRSVPLEVYGPPGTKRLVDGIIDGNDEDIHERLASSGGPAANGWKANVHEIASGIVYKDSRVTIRAFAVPHSAWKYAFGYRVETPDRTIVISGDTRESPAIAAACNGCDVLIHEVYSDSGFKMIPARCGRFIMRRRIHPRRSSAALQRRLGPSC